MFFKKRYAKHGETWKETKFVNKIIIVRINILKNFWNYTESLRIKFLAIFNSHQLYSVICVIRLAHYCAVAKMFFYDKRMSSCRI